MKSLVVLERYTDICGRAWAEYADTHRLGVAGAWAKYLATINGAQAEYRNAPNAERGAA